MTDTEHTTSGFNEEEHTAVFLNIFLDLKSSLEEYDSAEFMTSANSRDDEIGAGTFSEVLRCRHPRFGIVVVKCFGLTGDTTGMNRRIAE